MYVLIGGAGLVGLSLAQKLVELGHTVAVIDIDPTACRYAREQVGAMAFEGSAVIVTKPGCLHQVIDFIEGCNN